MLSCRATVGAHGALIAQRPSGAITAARRRCRPTVPRAAATIQELQAAAAGAGTEALFEPLQLGDVHLKHRVVMAPLTRCRALGGVPQPNMVEYYRQRASDGGLIISEAACISETAHGYPNTPTLNRPESLEGWRPIVEAVHSKGGLFFHQLWHCGRASHQDYQPGGQPPLAPSAVAIDGPFQVFSPKDFQMHDYPVPRPMAPADIRQAVADFAAAAKNSLGVGADGVEIHGASGYLVNQLLNSRSNQRTDEYGGSIENRCRFALQVVEAVCEAAGSAGKVGIRFSPFGHYLMTPCPTTYATYTHLLTELNKFGLAYMHLVEPRSDDLPLAATLNVAGGRPDSLAPFRQVYGGNILAAGGYRGADGAKAVQSGHCDAVAYGRQFISNPDLPRRFALGAPLNLYDRDTFYGTGGPCDEGFIDYPVLEETPEGKAFLQA